MDRGISNLLLEGVFAEVPNDAVVVYMILRADISVNSTVITKFSKKSGDLISGLSVQSVAQKSGLPILTVVRNLEVLSKKRWLKIKKSGGGKVYFLGHIDGANASWLMQETPVKKAHKSKSEVLKDYVRECQSRRKKARDVVKPRISSEARRHIASETMRTSVLRPAGASGRILRVFLDSYEVLYKEEYPKIGSNRGTHYKFINSFLKYCDENEKLAAELLRFLFNNWGLISRDSSRVEIKSLNSIKFVKMLRMYMSQGIPARDTSISKRYDKESAEDSPDHGFV